MIFDEQLKWDKHDDDQCKKISKNIDLKRRETLMTFKALTGKASPDYLAELFTECENDYYCLRSNNTK